ncbi:MAG: dienelactone hydrolase family protein [Chloroflexota bacterium]
MMQTQPEGYLALPTDGEGPGVLVLHAWWGLNDTIKTLCDRLAGEGYTVFAPDLYHGQVADTIAGAEALGNALDSNYLQASAEIVEAVNFLEGRSSQSDHGVAVVSFSLGAYYALVLAAAEPERVHSVVLFYGAGGGDFSTAKAAFLGHFAENDIYEPLSSAKELEEELRSAGCSVTFHVYPNTEHWFFEPDRTDAYNEAAANLAWERTLSFLNEQTAS